MNSKINELKPNIEQIVKQINTHMQTVNTDFSEVMSSYREQTINSVNAIKKSTLDTASMIMHDLPKKIGDITAQANSIMNDLPKKVNDISNQIPEAVNKSITKSLKSNAFVFIPIFFFLTLSCAWYMGEKVGYTMKYNLYDDVYKNYAISKAQIFCNSNRSSVKH